MTYSGDAQLLKMAEQISANVGARLSPEAAAAKTVDHINRFWTTDMKYRLVDTARLGGADVSEVVMLAVDCLVEPV